jgi:hypothetical protein
MALSLYPKYQLNRRLGSLTDDLRCCEEERNLLSLPESEPLVLSRAAYSPVTNLTKLFQLPLM